jgi:hypothetical protein
MIVATPDWSRIASLAGLAPDASPTELIAALESRAGSKAAANAAREARWAAIRACRRCDPSGWRLGPDGAPTDPARRCDHSAVGSHVQNGRDITAPIHERNEEL